ncbi:AarF/ABC1/UbiB kinase family protein [Ammoniphilus sp. CFH 90114]|uniref:ABC1 kinase family protein n=1 Tax=Ammoniphilus sp. CFH 90114 TaxID=2493665 RepID=UPI00100F07B8|nr:AarF/UbiB family protein [Ammoniphilus sp. CFH 90114]RXT06980.1 AarF/ABC1/UbiB kinase family protein [Ammoniphilus sp. CFH 90114]
MKWKWFRMVSIVGMALRFFLQIFWYQWRKKTGHEWDGLMRRQAREFREKAIRLQGLLIKVGQFLSTRGDMLPKPFVEEITRLVDQVPAGGWDQARVQLEREWGTSYREILRSVGSEPVASASIGEVYRAELLDGTSVAVKIQRTGIDKVIAADFQALRIITWIARFTPFSDKANFPMLYKEMKTVIERELDFKKEMETAQQFKERFQREEVQVYIPEVYSEYTTKKVLVMEWVEGQKITDTDFLNQSGIDRKGLAERLLKLFIPQYLEQGKFHADPHSGNVLVNEKGEIILLDFGMMGEISKKDAEHLQQLLIALGVKNYAKAVEHLIKLEFVLPSANRKEMEVMLEEALSFDLKSFKQMTQMEMLKMKMELQKVIEALPIQVPTRFVFLGRSFITVEGLIATIYPDGDVVGLGEPILKEWFEQHQGGWWKLVASWVQGQPFFQTLQSLPSLLEEPRRYREWQEEAQRRSFEFEHARDKKRDAFIVLVLSIVLAFIAYGLRNPTLWMASVLLAGVSGPLYFIVSRKVKKLIRRK